MKIISLLLAVALWIGIMAPAPAGAEDLGALRLSQMEGDVQVQSTGVDDWIPAAINLPVRVGDRIWVPKESWAQIETRGGSVVRLDAESSMEILAVDADSLQVYLSQGQAYANFRKGMDTLLQVDTPLASVRVYDSSTFNVALAENGNTEVSVFRGAVYTENRSGQIRVGAGKMTSMDDGLPALTTLGPPSEWEKWNREWDDLLTDVVENGEYLPPELAGYEQDLQRNGRWLQTSEYGQVWTPTTFVSVDWAPYRHGRWVWIGNDYVWVAHEPWGWAPYHYGRWAHIPAHGWCWVPPPRHEVYWGPGYVSWVLTDTNIAWVPLAPAEIYYGHGYYGPHSINILHIDIRTVNIGRHYRNALVHNAVTVVHRDTFLHGRHHDVRPRENPFLNEHNHFGRPEISHERVARMPVLKDIPQENAPPEHLRALPDQGKDERPLVRNRGRSVFTPTATPRVVAPVVRMKSDSVVKEKEEEGGTPASVDRQQIREHSVAPRESREQFTPDTKSQPPVKAPVAERQVAPVSAPVQIKGTNAEQDSGQGQLLQNHRGMIRPKESPAPESEPQQPVVTPETVRQKMVQPPPAEKKENIAPDQGERQESSKRMSVPEAFQDRSAPDSGRQKPVVTPETVRQQMAAPPSPAPASGKSAKSDDEALKRKQAAEKEKEKEEAQQQEADKIREMLEKRGGGRTSR